MIYCNRFNKKNSADKFLPRDYIEIVNQELFLKDPNKYIELAYNKSQNIESYNIKKQKED